ncbi:MAG: cytochrome c oxidase subunit II [Actinomycetota bacterium]|nr:cytochrome c oxidase subunit II [Actinomycetota bacterium]
MSATCRRAAMVTAAVATLGACSGSGPQSALTPEGPIARQIDDLWDLVFVLAVVVFVLVMAVFAVSIFRFRERKSDTREPRQIHGNTPLEISWTILPAVLLAVLAVPTVRGIFEVRAAAEGPDVIQVNVTGHQWWWEFEFPDMVSDDGRTLVTANELHIPAGVKVQLNMTSRDVIHSFWVPPLNGKRDVVPGRITQLVLEADPGVADKDFGFGPGVIPGQCAEFCGLSHADMRLRVFVQSPAEFEAWAAAQLEPVPVPTEGAAAAGYETFNSTCTACHQAVVADADGTVTTLGAERTLEVDGVTFLDQFGPDLTHFGGRSTLGAAILENSEEHLGNWIDNPSDLKPMAPLRNDLEAGRVLGMPSYGLDSEQIAQLVELLEGWQ